MAALVAVPEKSLDEAVEPELIAIEPPAVRTMGSSRRNAMVVAMGGVPAWKAMGEAATAAACEWLAEKGPR